MSNIILKFSDNTFLTGFDSHTGMPLTNHYEARIYDDTTKNFETIILNCINRQERPEKVYLSETTKPSF